MKLENFHLRGVRGQMVVGFGVKGLGAATSFLFTFLLARIAGAAGVGTFGTSLTTVQLCVTLSLLGLDAILVRSVSVHLALDQTGRARAAARHALLMGTSAGLALTTVIVLFHWQIAVDLIGSPAMAKSLMVLSLIIPIMVYCRLLSTVLRGVKWIGLSQFIDGPLTTSFGSLVLAVVLVMGVPVSAVFPSQLYLIGWLITAALATFLYTRAVRSWQPRVPLEESLLKPGFLILVANLNNVFTDWFATIMLAATHGPAEAGLFRVGYQIAATLKLFSATSETILQPVFAVAYRQGDLRRIGRILRLTILGLILISAPLALAVLVVPQWIMRIFGAQFTAGATAMQIMVLGQVFSLVFAASGSVLMMASRERLTVVLTTISAVIGTVLSLIFIPPYGALGAAIAILGPLLFLRLASMIAVRRLGVPIF
ncbi:MULTISPECIES: oligosaccharide flippase family protein [Sphingomonas]|uniref:O-antigen/teichoic acid export membrane protein n=1 Tax=Sphingomonas trueperi TaxID=53317 RepID=A0A7X6BBW4_9SPHN|nr:oligosaccharide flippase family protein [Sphingomonas sp. ABOLD]NJB96630.1 O-antigen/teichoic acid export membrane protein [Sphingomonas trueperi]